MGTMASQITSLTSIYSTVYSGADERKHQSSASLAFVRGIHRGPVNSPHKWPVTRKCFHLMTSSCNSRKTAIARPLGRDLAAFQAFEIWTKFCFRIYCPVCNIVLYCTAVYRESIVSINIAYIPHSYFAGTRAIMRYAACLRNMAERITYCRRAL